MANANGTKKKKNKRARVEKRPVPRELAIRHVMQANTSKNTKPELVVRTLLRKLGWPGYRLHWKTPAGRPDIVYPGRKVAIFVNGCFWHRHEGCKKATQPKSNQEFWNAKFERNVARDKRVTQELEGEGWKVVTIWECELGREKIEKTSEYLYEVMTLADEESKKSPGDAHETHPAT